MKEKIVIDLTPASATAVPPSKPESKPKDKKKKPKTTEAKTKEDNVNKVQFDKWLAFL